MVYFPMSSYLSIFCVYFYCYSAVSWDFHILNHPSHKNFILESYSAQSTIIFAKLGSTYTPHMYLIECHLPFFLTWSFRKIRTFFCISVNSQHWITVVSANCVTSFLQPLTRPFANMGYHSLWFILIIFLPVRNKHLFLLCFLSFRKLFIYYFILSHLHIVSSLHEKFFSFLLQILVDYDT